MACWVRSVSPTADCAMPMPWLACWPISWIEPESSSVARTMISMRCAVSAEAEEAEPMRLSVSPATACNVAQVAVSETDASLIDSTTSPMAPSNSPIALSIAWRRAAAAASAACRCSVIALAMSKLMTCEIAMPRATALAAEKRYLRASALSAALST